MPESKIRKQPQKSPGGKRAELARWLAAHSTAEIGEPEFAEISRSLAPISETYLRKLLKESGAPLAPMVAGVRQSTLDELESSLLALLNEYEHGEATHRQAVRRLVITAKDHARFAHHDEAVLWLTTWLENPQLFPAWAKLRRENLK